MIREVVKATGDIITVAGNGTAGYSGDGGPATAAELNSPNGVAVDSAGDLFIADSGNNVSPRGGQGDRRHHHRRRQRHRRLQRRRRTRDRRRAEWPRRRRRRLRGRPVHRRPGNNGVREVVKATGDIITVAGNGTAGYSGDNGPATAAELDDPGRVAVDSAGDLFVADSDNNVVREFTPAVTVTISPAHAHNQLALSRRYHLRHRTRQYSARRHRQLDGSTVPGTLIYSPVAGTITQAIQTLSVTFNPTDTTNYQSVSTQPRFVVNPATPTINWPAPDIAYGTGLSTTQLDATASVPGASVYTPAASTMYSALRRPSRSAWRPPTRPITTASPPRRRSTS